MKQTFFYAFVMLATLTIFGCKEKQEPAMPEEKQTEEQPQESRVVKPLYAYLPVYHDWVWENETPQIEVDVVNPCNFDTTAIVHLDVYADDYGKDILVDSNTVVATLHAGDSLPVFISPKNTLAPNFYRVRVTRNGKQVRKFNIGVDPSKISSPYDGQADFDQFWSDTKKELRAADPQFKFDTIRATNQFTLVRVEAKSLNNKWDTAGIVRFYYSEPVKAGKYSCTVEFPGYDSNNTSSSFATPISGSSAECQLYVCPRGQYINRCPPFNNNYGDYVTHGVESKEHFYYRGAFMDVVRALDYLYNRDKVDTTQVFAFGSSQGGALTYVAAALSDHQFAAISCNVPFLGDWPDYFRVGSWPVQQMEAAGKKAGLDKEQLLAVLSYFDIKNLAPRVKCPVQQYYGLQDGTCPPHTNFSIYNNLTSVPYKEIYVGPQMGHEWTADWNTKRGQFFKKYKK